MPPFAPTFAGAGACKLKSFTGLTHISGVRPNGIAAFSLQMLMANQTWQRAGSGFTRFQSVGIQEHRGRRNGFPCNEN